METDVNLVNIPTGNRPSVAHFPGPSRDGPFQKWLFNEINTSPIAVSPPSAHMEIVCFASADVAESSPLVAQCKRLGVPLTVLGAHMSREEFAKRSHFNKLYLLRDHIDSGAASPYIVALVDMDAGVRVNAQLHGIPEAELKIGRRVKLGFEPVNKDMTLPVFVAE